MSRFQFSEPAFELPDVESVLDALEAAVVGPETPMFDAARQCWQPVARHPEVRAAWADRARYRPAGSGLELPPLPRDGAPLDPDADEVARRRAAYAIAIRGNRLPLEGAAPEPGSRRSLAAGLALVLALLVLVGVAVVGLASGLVRVAARATPLPP